METGRILTKALLFMAAAAVCAGQDLSTDWQAVLNRIRPDSLRGHLSFLASDLLEGRDTPSRGQAVAAEYIASRFRAAGLEPAGNNGYFHDTAYVAREADLRDFLLLIRAGGKTYHIRREQVTVAPGAAMEHYGIPAVIVRVSGDGKVPAIPPGSIVLLSAPPGLNPMQLFAVRQAVRKASPQLVIALDSRQPVSNVRVARPDSNPRETAPATIHIRQGDVLADAGNWTEAEVSVRLSGFADRPFAMRNVAAVLPGSDPDLRDTYVFLSAHYDHIGWLGEGKGDRVYNGANDDASGTSALLAIAESAARLAQRPKRTIVFLAVAGEEKGLLGSKEYLRNPTVPAGKIVANINMEHLGRTDTAEGDQTRKLNVTGFNFSELTGYVVQAGKRTGVSVTKNEKLSDPFFRQSDNLAFADKNIPAHTVSSGYLFGDYHGLGDHWDKIDYDHLAAVTRTIALALLELADSPVAPKWTR